MVEREVATGIVEGTGSRVRVGLLYDRVYWPLHHRVCRLFPQGFPCHTVTVLALSGCVACNLLSVLDVLWWLKLVPAPGRPGVGPGRFESLEAVAVVALALNLPLARRAFRNGSPGAGLYDQGGSWMAWYVVFSPVCWILTCWLDRAA